MRIYEPSGYVDIPSIIRSDVTFIFIWGGRGIGKTYGALKYIIEYLKDTDRRFMFLRRTQTQADLINRPELSPFKTICRDYHIHIGPEPIAPNMAGIYEYIDDDKRLIGYSAALSTFSNVRGFDGSDIDIIIYDEFIPQRSDRAFIRAEGEALANVVETINRNREFEGDKPVQLVCLSNANDIGNPIFREFNLVDIADRMQRNQKIIYRNDSRHCMLVNLSDSPIAEAKKDNALAEFMEGSDSGFYSATYDNTFIDDSIANISSKNLSGYDPVVTVGLYTIYKHKSGGYYMTSHRRGSPERYTLAAASLEKFRKKYYYLYNAYLNQHFDFETKNAAVYFENLW